MSGDQGKAEEAIVHILDDDIHMRDAISDILRYHERPFKVFETAEALLGSTSPDTPGCLILDIRLQSSDGLDLQAELRGRGYRMPIVFITGFGSIPMTVRAMRAGAVDFLTKPFGEEDLMRAVDLALAKNADDRAKDMENKSLLDLSQRLTNRERQVMDAVVRGLMNKQIAYELSLTEITVKLHRASLMKKLRVRTLPDLVRKVEALAALTRRDAPMPFNDSEPLARDLSQLTY